MQKNQYFPITLIAAVTLFSGCSSVPQNSKLSEAHSSYDTVRANPQVTSLAPVELKEAREYLDKADNASNTGGSASTVDHLAYMSKQKSEIALETSKRKADEQVVSTAGIKRDKVQLEARTNEVDAAKQKLAIVQATSDQQEAQLKELNAKETNRGMVVTLGDVLFSTDKSQVTSGGLHSVQKLADFLNQNQNYKVLVEGYTDSTGSTSYNQVLSEKRANTVRRSLLDDGISSDRVTMKGYGKAFPVDSNDTAAGRQLNRRVEIIFSDNKGNITPRQETTEQ